MWALFLTVRCSAPGRLAQQGFKRLRLQDGVSEERFIMLGLSNMLRILVVCHCECSGGDVIRIISARKATSNERKHYEGPSL
ncbi:BrnT family toxin [Ectothiorhodospira marina]|uniref:BrnT family toxin n=1 Tax=Ectothiorhodospira marina TaxID=1396821 RepID=UPI00115F96B1